MTYKSIFLLLSFERMQKKGKLPMIKIVTL